MYLIHYYYKIVITYMLIYSILQVKENETTANGKINFIKSLFSGGPKGALINLTNLLLILLLLFIFTLIVYFLVQTTTNFLTSLRRNELSKDPVRQFMYTDILFPNIGVFVICIVAQALLYVCIKVYMWFSKCFLKTKISTMYLT